jgi:hypothetical protein
MNKRHSVWANLIHGVTFRMLWIIRSLEIFCIWYFFWKPEGKRPLGRPRRRWENNIKIDHRELGWEGVDLIHLAQDRYQWRTLVNTIMKHRYHNRRRISWLAEWILVSQEGLSSMEPVGQSVSQSVSHLLTYLLTYLLTEIIMKLSLKQRQKSLKLLTLN